MITGKVQQGDGRGAGVRVSARPRDFCPQERAALLIIDMQNDFCREGGYFESKGYDPKRLHAPTASIRRVLDAARAVEFPVFHTRQGYRQDMADLPRFKAERNRRSGAPVGDIGPLGRLFIRGEPGWQIIPELIPLSNEPVIDKAANSAFCGTDFELILRSRGIGALMIVGVTTDVCVHSTLRHADDLGFECLLIEDCCASGEEFYHDAAIRMTLAEGGVFGCVASSDDVVAALTRMPG